MHSPTEYCVCTKFIALATISFFIRFSSVTSNCVFPKHLVHFSSIERYLLNTYARYVATASLDTINETQRLHGGQLLKKKVAETFASLGKNSSFDGIGCVHTYTHAAHVGKYK